MCICISCIYFKVWTTRICSFSKTFLLNFFSCASYLSNVLLWSGKDSLRKIFYLKKKEKKKRERRNGIFTQNRNNRSNEHSYFLHYLSRGQNTCNTVLLCSSDWPVKQFPSIGMSQNLFVFFFFLFSFFFGTIQIGVCRCKSHHWYLINVLKNEEFPGCWCNSFFSTDFLCLSENLSMSVLSELKLVSNLV